MPLPAWPVIEHDLPRCHPLLRHVGRFMYWVMGWRLEGTLPRGLRRAVVIQAPHTSNWDLPIGLFGTWMHGASVSWMGKRSLFVGPFGVFLRWLGGVSVDRRAPQGMVEQVADQFRSADGMLLVIPPEGTRSARDYWKSGFWWIAREADVPVICGKIDYARKVAGFFDLLEPTDDIGADMDRVRAIYEGVTPRYPEGRSRIRLRAEDDGSA